MEAVQPFDGDKVYSACWEGLDHSSYGQVFGQLAGKFLKVSKEHTSHLKCEIGTPFSGDWHQDKSLPSENCQLYTMEFFPLFTKLVSRIFYEGKTFIFPSPDPQKGSYFSQNAFLSDYTSNNHILTKIFWFS